MTSLPEISEAQDTEGQLTTALTCYLATIVDIANSMGEVCPHVGLIYKDRLLRLPRRLGFDATAEALSASRKAVEQDLAEYTAAASAWLSGESDHSRRLLALVSTAVNGLRESDEFHSGIVGDLADQMAAAAEVDDVTEVRASMARYAAGLRACAERKKKQDVSVLNAMQVEAKALEESLVQARVSSSIDPLTGLLNRHEAVNQLGLRLKTSPIFSVLVFHWDEERSILPFAGRSGADQITKKLAERLTAMVRPRDIVCRWGVDQLAVIFGCSAKQAAARATKISDWLSDTYAASVEGAERKVEVKAVVSVIEHLKNEALESFIQRVDEVR